MRLVSRDRDRGARPALPSCTRTRRRRGRDAHDERRIQWFRAARAAHRTSSRRARVERRSHRDHGRDRRWPPHPPAPRAWARSPSSTSPVRAPPWSVVALRGGGRPRPRRRHFDGSLRSSAQRRRRVPEPLRIRGATTDAGFDVLAAHRSDRGDLGRPRPHRLDRGCLRGCPNRRRLPHPNDAGSAVDVGLRSQRDSKMAARVRRFAPHGVRRRDCHG